MGPQATLRLSAQRRATRMAIMADIALWLTGLLLAVLGATGMLGWMNPVQAQVIAQVPAAAAPYRTTLVRAAHSQWGLDAPIATFAAQVHQESAWKPNAVSRVGAAGLAQFMPATSRWWCTASGTALAECQPQNPTWALRSLVGYDRYLFERTPERFNTYDRFWVTLRGYNGGLGHWQAEAKATGTPEPSREQVDAACGKARRSSVHCPENLGYPKRIMMLQAIYAAWGAGV
jgi:soluble lytic murein transglycosylase-like protein